MSQSHPYFFGYGSLVNTSTHDYQAPTPARLKGWRRNWCHTSLRNISFLSATADPTCTIDGLIAAVPNADWEALDEREFAYERNPVSADVSHDVSNSLEISVYAIPENRKQAGSKAHPILLSYLDVVVQGYLHVFGEDGVQRFFDTTSGWETPILDDRTAPQYPRHQVLTQEERELVDHHLSLQYSEILR
ncbi:hypothetical protein RSK20926_13649 [Roseobacter sp. SK209-2-6]|uniref:gamma-glutamylcyclotransferase family protein n=1 Tax=Roseobacter sp. SK209-2-6 TaxID=388739 RepID=UPI0000F3D650|nr:gamma-glutamylcyclotransferase family protein [Roseobacter sp. SK209-2-6]EBA15679.1 hypothetical protein RSK20926_13649 [Roseobacter sp. SK209-2-6]